MVRTEREMTGVYGPVILTTRPAPRGFISRYILGLTPIAMVVLSLIALTFLPDLLEGTTRSTVHSLQTIVPELPQYLEICILLIAPIGIFLFFIWLGDVIHRTEIWTGAGLTILLSIIGALVMVQGSNLPMLSTGYLLTLFQWVAYLVQPFSIVAAIMVISGDEAFRRTLRYTLTKDVVIITGGIWTQVENVIPLRQIERIVLVQGRLGHLFHFGTVVPEGKVFGLAGTDMTGHQEPGDVLRDTEKVSVLRWQQGSYNPLVCLYGIVHPEDMKSGIERAMQQRVGKGLDSLG
jgi:hypothetical protein